MKAPSLKSPLLLLLALPLIFLASTAESRPLSPDTLAARLQLSDNSSSPSSSSTCWDSLFELQACSSEVILFFLNGETYLGPDCCDAIYVIEHHCWPSMLGSLGFTAEEGNVLRGYCDGSHSSFSPPSPPPESETEDLPAVHIDQNLLTPPN